jgi:hypothetical protein
MSSPAPEREPDLAELRAKIAAATPGPWEASDVSDIGAWVRGEWDEMRGEWLEITDFIEPANAELIVAAVNNLAALLDGYERQKGALEQLEGWDMLALRHWGPMPHHPYNGWFGVSTSDAPWARRLIAKALGKHDPTDHPSAHSAAALAPPTTEVEQGSDRTAVDLGRGPIPGLYDDENDDPAVGGCVNCDSPFCSGCPGPTEVEQP